MLKHLLMGCLVVLLVTTMRQESAAFGAELTLTNDMLTPASILQKEARGPNRYSYAVNLLVGLNSSMTISTLNQSRAIYWALTQRLSNSSSTKTTQIFNLANPTIRHDSLIRSTYQCAPNETDCNSITVSPIRLHSIGDYSYQSLINTLDSLYVDYNVSAWIQPLDMQCSLLTGIVDVLTTNQTACAVNKTQNTISVLGSNRVTLSCSVLIAQNDVYEPQADLVIRSVEDNLECSDSDSTQVRQISPLMASVILAPLESPNSTPVNTILYRLTRNCTRVFTKAALSSHVTCQLQPRLPMVVSQFDTHPAQKPYTAVSFLVDVQYAPEYSAPPSQQFNRTMIVNSTSSSSGAPVFSCPFESNPPPQFEWRVSLVVINRTDSAAAQRRRLDPTEFHTAGKDFVIPRDLEIGLYGFECRAHTHGLVNKYSDNVKFFLNVIPVPVSSKKAILNGDRQNSYFKSSSANVGAIVGGVIGGVLFIAIIVLLSLYLIRRYRNGMKDEPEKAKELDIGINENNPHLSSRSNLSTAGLTANGVVNGAVPTATTTTNGSTSSSSSSSSSASSTSSTIMTTTTTTTAALGTSSNGKLMNGGVAAPNKATLAGAGLMLPTSTVQSYAAIAHAAAAIAARNHSSTDGGINKQSYNNPGFFESATTTTTGAAASYSIQQNLESPPPYDSTLHHQSAGGSKKEQQQQSHMMLQKDYMGSNSRLLSGGPPSGGASGSTTPTLIRKNPAGTGAMGVTGTALPQSHSYTGIGGNALSMTPNGTSLQQMQQYASNGSGLQYTTVQNLQAGAGAASGRSRQPLNTADMGQDPATTQYTTMTQLNPIDV